MAEKKGFIDDATDVIINEIMPKAVRWLLDKIPEDKYEEIFQDKKRYWELALPFFSFAILRVANSPKVVDDLTTEFFAEVRREINRRAEESSPEEEEKNKEKKEQKSSGESFGITYAKTNAGLRSVLADRLNRLVDEEEKAALFNVNLAPKDSQQIINNLVTCDEDEFPELVSLLIPKKKQKVEPAKRINVVAEMVKHPELLKRFTELEEKEKSGVLTHLSRLPVNQITDHFQILSKMDYPGFLLYVEAVMSEDRERIWPQTKKVGEGVWESFKKWWEEGEKSGEKKLSLSEAFKAGKNSRRKK